MKIQSGIWDPPFLVPGIPLSLSSLNKGPLRSLLFRHKTAYKIGHQFHCLSLLEYVIWHFKPIHVGSYPHRSENEEIDTKQWPVPSFHSYPCQRMRCYSLFSKSKSRPVQMDLPTLQAKRSHRLQLFQWLGIRTGSAPFFFIGRVAFRGLGLPSLLKKMGNNNWRRILGLPSMIGGLD